MNDEQVRQVLDDRSKESKEALTLDKLSHIFHSDLRTNMMNPNAKTRRQELFAIYIIIPSPNSVKWIITDKQGIAVQYILSTVRRPSLRDRLTSYLSFAHHDIFKDFMVFLHHTIRFAEALYLLDCVLPPKSDQDITARSSGNWIGGTRSVKKRITNQNQSSSTETPVQIRTPNSRSVCGNCIARKDGGTLKNSA